MKTTLGILVVVTLCVLAFWTTSSYVKYSREFSKTYTNYNEQYLTINTIYTDTWATAKQELNLTNNDELNFRAVFISIMATGGDDSVVDVIPLFEKITETNPAFTNEHYDRAAAIIMKRLPEFTNVRTELFRNYNILTRLTTTAPSRWFLRGKKFRNPSGITFTRI